MPYPRGGLSGLSGTLVDPGDLATVAAAVGFPDPQSGYGTWDATAAAIAAAPYTALLSGGQEFTGGWAASALIDVWRAIHAMTAQSGYLPTADQVVAALVPGFTLQDLTIDLLPPPAGVPVSAGDWSRYVSNVHLFASRMVDLFAASSPTAVAPPPAHNVAPLSAQDQAVAEWYAALARGVVTFDNGQGHTYSIPAEYVVEGPVHLPDGTRYLTYYDPRLVAFGQAGAGGSSNVVVWNLVPTVREVNTANYNTLTGHYFVEPGTGTWYLNHVLGHDAMYDGGSAIPAGFAGPFPTVSALAIASVTPGSSGVATVTPAAPPPASVLVSESGTGGVAPSPIIVTQDAAGNVIAGDAIAAEPAAPAVVSTVPGANLVTVTTAPSVSPALIAVGVVAGLWFLSRGNR